MTDFNGQLKKSLQAGGKLSVCGRVLVEGILIIFYAQIITRHLQLITFFIYFIKRQLIIISCCNKSQGFETGIFFLLSFFYFVLSLILGLCIYID